MTYPGKGLGTPWPSITRGLGVSVPERGVLLPVDGGPPPHPNQGGGMGNGPGGHGNNRGRGQKRGRGQGQSGGGALSSYQFGHWGHLVSSGSAAQSITGGIWNVRTINIEHTNEITGASLASNQITLPAGTYYIEAASSTTAALNDNKLAVYDTTASAYVAHGMNAFQRDYAEMVGYFILAATSVIEIQHYPDNSTTAGSPVSSGQSESYLDVLVWRVV